MGIYSTENTIIINEVYFGQTPGITRVFEAFCKFRDKYVNSRKSFTGNIDSLHDPDLGVFISEMEREFGIYSYSFIVEYDDTVNMDSVVIEIQQSLDQIAGYWGDSVGTPMIMKISLCPVATTVPAV